MRHKGRWDEAGGGQAGLHRANGRARRLLNEMVGVDVGLHRGGHLIANRPSLLQPAAQISGGNTDMYSGDQVSGRGEAGEAGLQSGQVQAKARATDGHDTRQADDLCGLAPAMEHGHRIGAHDEIELILWGTGLSQPAQRVHGERWPLPVEIDARAAKPGLSAMASSTMARRSSALKKVPGSLSGETRAGTNSTWARASRTRASSAMTRWPM